MTTAQFQLDAPRGGRGFLRRPRAFTLFCKDVLQGLLSGVFLLSGMASMAPEDGLISQLAHLEVAGVSPFTGETMAGGLQILAAALLFVSARGGVARTLGLTALIGYLALQHAGFMGDDFLAGASDGLRRLADTLEAASASMIDAASGA